MGQYLGHSELYVTALKLAASESERLSYASKNGDYVPVRPSLPLLVHIILHHYLIESTLQRQEDGTVFSTFYELSVSEQVTQTHDLYMLLFSVSSSFGGFAQIVWDRALGLSLENPKSVDMPFIEEFYRNVKKDV